jgi:small subunit ribosomal protein S6
MKRRYEALLVLDTKGREDTIKDTIERLEQDFIKEGAEVELIQKMDKRQFSHVAGPLDSGFYVNYIFWAEPGVAEKLQAKFKLDDTVYRQYYSKLKPKAAVAK